MRTVRTIVFSPTRRRIESSTSNFSEKGFELSVLVLLSVVWYHISFFYSKPLQSQETPLFRGVSFVLELYSKLSECLFRSFIELLVSLFLYAFEARFEFLYPLAVCLLAVRVLVECLQVCQLFLSLLEFRLDHLDGWAIGEDDWCLQVLECVDGCILWDAGRYTVYRRLKHFILEDFDPYRTAAVVPWWAVIVVFAGSWFHDSSVE